MLRLASLKEGWHLFCKAYDPLLNPDFSLPLEFLLVVILCHFRDHFMYGKFA